MVKGLGQKCLGIYQRKITVCDAFRFYTFAVFHRKLAMETNMADDATTRLSLDNNFCSDICVFFDVQS